MTKINEISQEILSFLHKKALKQDVAAIVKNLKTATENQTVLLEITSTIPLNSVQEDKLKLIFAKRLQGNFKIKNKIDKNIIAGLIVRYKDFLIDESLLGKLELLRKSVNGY